MTASNDNKRVRKKSYKKRGNKAPRSLAKMTRVLADIYADPSYSITSQQDEALTWLGDERHVPALRGADVER